MEETLSEPFGSPVLKFLSGMSTPSLEPASSDGGSMGAEPVVKPRRKPIPRKGHRKSRRGCLQCKKRKVKCQETLPECGNCTRLGLGCDYPRANFQPVSSPSQALQSPPTLFTLEDLRFFQHFLVTAYPPLPFEGEAIWRDVATMSHEYDYLVHAMLGLAASHLDLSSEGNYATQALDHRVTAINSLNDALSRPCLSKADGDARFAAMMALSFQSSYMPDGMVEFLSMTRGCHIIATTAMPDFNASLFRDFSPEGHARTVKKVLTIFDTLGSLDNDDVTGQFLASLQALARLSTSTLQLSYVAATEKVVQLAATSAVEAFAEVASSYNLLHTASNEEFVAFLHPENYVSQIILMHFFLIEYAIGFLALGTAAAPFVARQKVNPIWLDRLASGIPKEYEKHLTWVRKFQKLVFFD